MKRIHLLRVEGTPSDYAPLIAAIRRDGGCVGWLELDSPEPLPPRLSEAADAGALRAVATSATRTLAVKSLRGRPVLADLLREHFRGCRAVLVRGELEAPTLRRDGDGWIVYAGETERPLDSGALAAALRRPRPWG